MSEQGEQPPGKTSTEAEGSSDSGATRTASEDLAEGLDLMLRAAKKAMRQVDPANVEKLGRRALDSIEHLKRERVEELGRKAKRRLDPKRIEEIAEEAGRELLRVVERVAERVDAVVKPSASQASPSSADSDDEPSASSDEPGDSPRVRVEE